MLFAVASTIFTIVGPKVLGNATTELFNGIMGKITGAGAGIDFGAIANILLTLLILYLTSLLFSYGQGWIMTGITMVFVPAVSTFIISRMLGGGSNMMIGDLIELQFLGNAYNPNLGAAISLGLMILILFCMSMLNQLNEEDKEGMII